MTVAKHIFGVVAAASAGAILMGTWTLSRPESEMVVATDGMMIVAVFAFLFSSVLWLVADMDENTDIDVKGLLSDD
jgi:mannitol-specific phosphotransferase system IIBC component